MPGLAWRCVARQDIDAPRRAVAAKTGQRKPHLEHAGKVQTDRKKEQGHRRHERRRLQLKAPSHRAAGRAQREHQPAEQPERQHDAGNEGERCGFHLPACRRRAGATAGKSHDLQADDRKDAGHQVQDQPTQQAESKRQKKRGVGHRIGHRVGSTHRRRARVRDRCRRWRAARGPRLQTGRRQKASRLGRGESGGCGPQLIGAICDRYQCGRRRLTRGRPRAQLDRSAIGPEQPVQGPIRRRAITCGDQIDTPAALGSHQRLWRRRRDQICGVREIAGMRDHLHPHGRLEDQRHLSRPAVGLNRERAGGVGRSLCHVLEQPCVARGGRLRPGFCDDRQIERQSGLTRHADLLAHQPGHPSLEARACTAKPVWQAGGEGQHHLALIAVVGQRTDPDPLRRRPAQCTEGRASRPLGLNRGGQARVARIAPIGMPGRIVAQSNTQLDSPARLHSDPIGDQFGLKRADSQHTAGRGLDTGCRWRLGQCRERAAQHRRRHQEACEASDGLLSNQRSSAVARISNIQAHRLDATRSAAVDTARLDPRCVYPYHREMTDVMQTLEEQVARMLEGMKRLSEDNLALRAEIDTERQARHRLEARLDEARTRVESALGRLPAGPGDTSLSAQRSASSGTPLSTPSSTPLSKAD